MKRPCKQNDDDNRLTKITRNGKPNIPLGQPTLRKLDINTGEQAYSIKYRTCFYKKKRKKKKKRKIEDYICIWLYIVNCCVPLPN